ncbi:hypothetical protein [Desertivirga xinjiangensis]|uniref:hypothetical protein n=1 Tax=Desertivirga xinjiangensis TaxID=539206 RepID=UPI00210EA571|nr:hypothetical protein [Pedobacter xinjiangensis]
MKVFRSSYIVIIIFLCLFMGCTNESEDLNIIEGRGLPLEGESYFKMIFVNEKEGYLFRERHGEAVWKENGEAFRVDTSMVYRTADGGMTWEGQELGEGIIINAHMSGNDVYTIRCQNMNGRDNSIVHRLNRAANKWELFTVIDSYVRDADFSDSKTWVITKKESNGQFRLYTSKDRGMTWKVVVDRFVFQPVIDKTSFGFLESENIDSGIYDALITFDRITEKVNKEALPLAFQASLLRKDGKSLFVAGVENDSLSIYKRVKSNKYSLIYKINFGARTFPQELIIHDNQLILLVGERRGMYIENHIMKSVDGGKNWVEEKLYKPTYASPIAFYGNNENGVKTWIYSGAGTIQVVE